MKTPMQEHYFLLIESKEHYKKLLKQETSVEGKQHYQGAIWAIQKIIDYIVAERMLEIVAERMLEEEKEVMCEFADDYQRNCFQKSADDYYNETFNTKEK